MNCNSLLAPRLFKNVFNFVQLKINIVTWYHVTDLINPLRGDKTLMLVRFDCQSGLLQSFDPSSRTVRAEQSLQWQICHKIFFDMIFLSISCLFTAYYYLSTLVGH